MSTDINRVTLSGIVDEERSETSSRGLAIWTLRLKSMVEKWDPQAREAYPEPMPVEVKAFGKKATELEGATNPGDVVLIEGKLNCRVNEGRSGGTFYNVTAQAERVVVMGRAGQAEASKAQDEGGKGDGFDDSDIPF